MRYFLGANTSRGFYSLYDQQESEDTVWYIKGGPGNGKSTFMKTVAAAAKKAGRTVELVFCSGDPSSLDAIRIPEDRMIYVDATSPHIQEPSLPGVRGRYLDLSQYYRPGVRREEDAIREQFQLYRSHYRRSYELLRAAELASPERIPGLMDDLSTKNLDSMAEELAEELAISDIGGRERRIFISALTCEGPVLYTDTLAETGGLFVLESAVGLGPALLSALAEKCRRKGARMVLCPDPLEPERPEALLLPENGAAFLCRRKKGSLGIPVQRRIELDTADIKERILSCRESFRACEKLRSSLLEQATAELKNARICHDRLEEIYHPYVDFRGVTACCHRHIKSLGYPLPDSAELP